MSLCKKQYSHFKYKLEHKDGYGLNKKENYKKDTNPFINNNNSIYMLYR